MRQIIFRLDPGDKEGQETSERKLQKYEEYKQLLISEGETIVKEEQTKVKRMGNVMLITLK